MNARATLHTSRACRTGLARVAALAITLAFPLTAAFGYSSSAHAQSAATTNASSGPSKAAEKAPASRKLDPNVLFTEQERESWKQKIAAAPDEAERRKLRGQRLAELQRRDRAAKSASAEPAAPGAASQRVSGQARTDMARTAGPRAQPAEPR